MGPVGRGALVERRPGCRKLEDQRANGVLGRVLEQVWYPQRDSNPCRQLERLVS